MIPSINALKDKVVLWKGYKHPMVGDIKDLKAVRGLDGAIYSCWKVSWKEWFQMLFGKPVVVGILANIQPPICLTVGVETIPL